ncbi:MAG: hypothetical protein ABIU63_17585, partial [Chitinophagaceae bacterium]
TAKDKKELNEKAAPVNGDNAAAPVKATGKTRSAGARRIAVSKSVVGSFKKKAAPKKDASVKKAGPVSKKAGKGFAPWNKNKFKKKPPEE